MIKYRVLFVFGTWRLWTDIERPYKIEESNRRGFEELAQLAVKEALEQIPIVERKHEAHDYCIFEILSPSKVECVYYFDSLASE